MFLKKNLLSNLFKVSLFFFPISFVAGSLVVNLNTIFFLLFGFIYIYSNKLKLNFNIISYCLLCFFLVIIISSYNNIDLIGEQNFYKSIFLIRFYLIYILLEVLFQNNKIEIKYFFYVCYVLIILISLDLALQFFTGENILGYKPWEGRITGIFEHEAIAGSYIQKIFIFSLAAIFIKSYSNLKHKDLLIVISFLIIFFASYIANNRISFFILFSLSFFLLIFFKDFRKNLIIALIILIPIFSYFYKNDNQTNLRYKVFINKITKIIEFSGTAQDSSNEEELYNKKIEEKKTQLPNHLRIYITAYQSFEENYILGNGLKAFRYKCNKFLDKKNTLCSTHPHNYHLEILHDTGLLGFLSLFFFSLLLLIKNIKLILGNKISYRNKIIISLLLINFLIEIFPFKSTGSLFTTWNGTLLWLSIALLNFNKKLG